MGRKTVNVEDVVKWANNYLASPTTMPEDREGVMGLCEQVLHATNNYDGFSYLASEYRPEQEQKVFDVLRDGYDDTRRRYSTRKIGR